MNQEKSRNLAQVLATRLSEPDPLIQVVVGPRQIGKTTALRSVLDEHAVFESADSPVPLPAQIIETWWNQAIKTSNKILAIDEVQKIPGWTEMLKKLWDQTKIKPKVIVTGSSALLVEKGLRESMAGRYELIRAEHWNYLEANHIFGLSLEEFIEFGCYPGSIALQGADTYRWGQYIRDAIVEPAIGHDLLLLHPVEHPALLRQIFGAAVALPCQIVSLQKMQGQLHSKGSLPTIQHYLQLLADAFLVTGIQKYSPSLLRTRASSPKLIVHDNALLRAFERPIEKPIPPDRWGHYFENAVGARLVEAGFDTYYWTDRDVEVDFVVVGPNDEHWAVEVKSSVTSRSELKNIFYFCKKFPMFEPILISQIGQQLDGVKSIPAEEILSLHRRYNLGPGILAR